MRMMCDGYLLESASLGSGQSEAPAKLGSVGLSNLKWHKPVFPGDTLRMRFAVLEARPLASRPRVGLIRSQWEVYNQRADKVRSMQGFGMFRCRGSAAPE